MVHQTGNYFIGERLQAMISRLELITGFSSCRLAPASWETKTLLSEGMHLSVCHCIFFKGFNLFYYIPLLKAESLFMDYIVWTHLFRGWLKMQPDLHQHKRSYSHPEGTFRQHLNKSGCCTHSSFFLPSAKKTLVKTVAAVTSAPISLRQGVWVG